jgi:transposase
MPRGRPSKVTDKMRLKANFLYYRTNLSVTAIAKNLEISFETANKLIVGRDEWAKMEENNVSDRNATQNGTS